MAERKLPVVKSFKYKSFDDSCASDTVCSAREFSGVSAFFEESDIEPGHNYD